MVNAQAKEAADEKVNDQNNADRFLHQCVIHFELVPKGATVNQKIYVKVLKRLIEAVRRTGEESYGGIAHRSLTTILLGPILFLV
jgi:hypothetical protein